MIDDHLLPSVENIRNQKQIVKICLADKRLAIILLKYKYGPISTYEEFLEKIFLELNSRKLDVNNSSTDNEYAHSDDHFTIIRKGA